MRMPLLLLALGLFALGLSAGTTRAQERPNVLVFVADDAAWHSFGAYGDPHIKTPHLDRLAAEGLTVEKAFLTIAQCSPSRISILTGRYPHQTGAEDLHMPLPEDARIVPSYLGEAGYATGHLRKTHYGPHANEQFGWYDEASDDDFSAFSAFLDQSDDQPFFMWVGFTDPHRGYGQAPALHDPDSVYVPPQLVDDAATRADLALYYDEVARMDRQIGLMLNELDRRGLAENTLVVFLSDNGMPFPRAKGTAYDEGIRTPLLFRWPTVIEPGRVYEGLVSVIDLAPTFLDVAGLKPPEAMEGTSLQPIFADLSTPGREVIYAERNWHDCDEHIRALRTERYKLIVNAYTHLPLCTAADIGGSPSFRSLRRGLREGTLTPGQARLFEAPRARVELYDLDADPHELVNVADHDAYWETARALARRLDAWREATGDFPPDRRTRDDHTDRVTGAQFSNEIPPMQNK